MKALRVKRIAPSALSLARTRTGTKPLVAAAVAQRGPPGQTCSSYRHGHTMQTP
jgi:hypothetical protein